MKILIVDNDTVHRQLLWRQISRAGYDVVEADDGESAWRVLQREPIQLVITDWIMPRLDGLALTRRIRAADLPGYVYVILLSARSDRNDVVGGLDSGVDDYLVKPCDSRELRARIATGRRVLNLESRLRESLNQLQRLATHDTLTELYNRWAIYEYASAEVARAVRTPTPLSLVMLDIDRFQVLNALHGHPVGDLALRMVASTIKRSIRPYDKVGRWGGEEFLTVLPAASSQEAQTVAERIHKNIAAVGLPLPSGDSQPIQVSMGIASMDGSTELTADTLISRTERAVYQAKQAGADQVCLFSEQTTDPP